MLFFCEEHRSQSLGPDVLARLEEVWRSIWERAGALAFVGIVLCSERCGLSVTSDADNHSQLPTLQECDECCAGDWRRTYKQYLETNLSVSETKVHEVSDVAVKHFVRVLSDSEDSFWLKIWLIHSSLHCSCFKTWIIASPDRGRMLCCLRSSDLIESISHWIRR